MSTITKERLEPVIERLEHYATNVKWTNVQAAQDMLIAVDAMRRLLASLEAEPVCVIDQSNLDYLKSGSDADVWPASRTEMGDVLLYRDAPPAPVSVPDEWRSILQEMVSAMLAYEMDVGESAPCKHRKMMMRAGHLLESHRAAMLDQEKSNG